MAVPTVTAAEITPFNREAAGFGCESKVKVNGHVQF
jgi:hypothetical protein